MLRDEVHVWCTRAAADDGEVARLLSEEERCRAAALASREARQLFVAGRSALRRVLGAYLGCEPRDLPLEGRDGAAPTLALHSAADLRFSVAHSGSLALVALAWRRPVGVDVEVSRDDLEVDLVSERELEPREGLFLRSLAGAERRGAFLRRWTEREALLKASGTGLGGRPARGSWARVPLPLDAAHVGTVVAAGRGFRLRCFVLEPAPAPCVPPLPGDPPVGSADLGAPARGRHVGAPRGGRS